MLRALPDKRKTQVGCPQEVDGAGSNCADRHAPYVHHRHRPDCGVFGCCWRCPMSDGDRSSGGQRGLPCLASRRWPRSRPTNMPTTSCSPTVSRLDRSPDPAHGRRPDLREFDGDAGLRATRDASAPRWRVGSSAWLSRRLSRPTSRTAMAMAERLGSWRTGYRRNRCTLLLAVGLPTHGSRRRDRLAGLTRASGRRPAQTQGHRSRRSGPVSAKGRPAAACATGRGPTRALRSGSSAAGAAL